LSSLTDLSRNAFTLSDGTWEKEGGGLAKIVASTSLDSISMVSCQKNVKKIRAWRGDAEESVGGDSAF
jgi:hypothetical protein